VIILTLDQPEFGQNVRDARITRGLSQTDLAGEQLSPSYISLIESGRRKPNIKAAEAIADRLGISLEELSSPRVDPEAGDRRAEEEADQRANRLLLVSRLVAARMSQLSGDWSSARDQLEDLVRQADKSGTEEVLWEARWELAATLGHLCLEDARAEVLRLLLADSMTESSPLLQLRVAVESAHSHRRSGDLSDSIRMAEQAVRAGELVDFAAPEKAQAYVALLAAFAVSGEWQRASAISDMVLGEVTALGSGHSRIVARWAVAGVRYMTGRPEEAVRLLADARHGLTPDSELKVRIQLLRASALLELAVGRPEAAPLVEQTRQLVEIAGTGADRVQLAALQVAAGLRRGERPSPEAIELDHPELLPLERARCGVVIARAHRVAGRGAEADAAYRDAAAGYEKAGALRHAVEVWREFTAPEDDPGHAFGTERQGDTPDCHAVVIP
jgi:transcriptional regulator with XRE-family HTH domain